LDNRVSAVLVVALLAVVAAAGYEAGSSGAPTRLSTESTVSTQTSVSTVTSVSTTTLTQPVTETATSATTIRVTEPSSGEIPSIATIEESNTTIEGYPNAVAANYATGTLYITDAFSSVLTVVNGTTDSVSAAITMPATPTGIIVDSSTDAVFVSIGDCTNVINVPDSCDANNSVATPPEILAINGSTYRPFWVDPVDAVVVAVDEGDGLLYATQNRIASPVANSTGSLLALSAGSGVLFANISLPASPQGVSFVPSTNTLYVSACQTLSIICGGAEILVVNGTDRAISANIPVPGWGFSGVMVDTFTNTGYLLVYSNVTKLISIDLNSDKQLSATVLGSTCAGISLLGVNLPEGQLYAVGSGEDSNANLLLVINAGTGNIVNMFSSPGQFEGFTQGNDGYIYTIIQSSSPDQTSGSLVSLDESLPTGFVNLGLIATGLCLP